MIAAVPAAIRAMTPDDVEPATAALVRGDWGERRAWFEFAVRAGHCDPIVAVVDDEVVGTGVGTRHGTVGWVGTIFVADEHRRKGIGQALSAAVCDGLEAAGCRTLVLVATELGRPVYERLGFREATWYRILEREADADGDTEAPAGVRAFTAADLEAAARIDREATGEDRRATIEVCAREPGGLAVEGPAGDLRGFALRAPWGGVATIAPDPDDAIALVRARLRAAVPGHMLRTGLVEMNTEGLSRAQRDGWTESRRVLRMGRGDPLDWHPDSIWGQWGMAVG
jgi:predicted N-acetyltransferase YhbS